MTDKYLVAEVPEATSIIDSPFTCAAKFTIHLQKKIQIKDLDFFVVNRNWLFISR